MSRWIHSHARRLESGLSHATMQSRCCNGGWISTTGQNRIDGEETKSLQDAAMLCIHNSRELALSARHARASFSVPLLGMAVSRGSLPHWSAEAT